MKGWQPAWVARPVYRAIAAAMLGIVAIVTLAWIVMASITTSSYHELEDREVVLNVRRATDGLDKSAAELERVASDYAQWTETYAFLEGERPSYLDTNVSADSLEALNADAFVLCDRDGDIVGSRAYDHVSREETALPAELAAAITGAASALDLYSPTASAKGLLRTETGQPLLFGAHAITTSSADRVPNGYLIIARGFDDRDLAALSETTHLDVGVVPPDGIPAEGAAHRVDTASDTVTILEDGKQRIAGYTVLRDALGAPAIALRVAMPRTIARAGEQVRSLLGTALLGFGVVAAAGTTYVLRRREYEQSQVNEARFQTLIQGMADAVIGIDAAGRIVLANAQSGVLLGLPAEELIGRAYGDIVSTDARDRVRRRLEHTLERGTAESFMTDLVHRSGRLVPVEISSSPMRSETGHLTGAQWIARDITERRRLESELVHLANRDHLTGLFNRRRFEQELERQLEAYRRTGRGGAILWLDLDNFKEINDGLGHSAGDRVLVELAHALMAGVREGAMLARLGGDEFAVLMPETSPSDAEGLARRLLNEIREVAVQFEGCVVHVTSSIGVVLYPQHGATAEELLAHADLAMYDAKESGRNQMSLYDPEERVHTETRSRFDWAVLIDRAIRQDLFLVFAQPILDLETGSYDRHELLIRMEADDEILAPGSFLPIAERLGHITEIDRWMVRRAIDLISMRTTHGHPFRLDVNLSGRALSDAELLATIQSELLRTQIDPSLLGLEITETAAIADLSRARTFIETLKRLGCRVALDDFGSGFSSFYYLRNLPIDSLKIDGSFVRNLASNAQDQHVVRAIVELARGFDIASTAEFVEDGATLAMLKDLGVSYAQGYHIARPVPVEDVMFGDEGAGHGLTVA